MYYIFRQSYIWDGARNINESRPPRVVKAKTEAKARKKLKFELGREWVLVGTRKNKYNV